MIRTEFLTESISFSVSWFSGSAPIVTVCLLFATSHSLSHSSKLNTSFRIESSGKFSVIVLRFVNLPLILLDSLSAREFSSSISAQFGTGEFDIVTGLASCADARLIKVPLFKWLNLKWPCPDSYLRPDNTGWWTRAGERGLVNANLTTLYLCAQLNALCFFSKRYERFSRKGFIFFAKFPVIWKIWICDLRLHGYERIHLMQSTN